MTYYGYEVTFTFTFECGCIQKKGPILEKFAYQYAQLGKKQTCPEHGGVEVDRKVAKHGKPHGNNELGYWRRADGTWIFLTWTPATGWVDLSDRVDPDNLQGSLLNPDSNIDHLVQIADQRTIWKIVGGGEPAPHLGGKWTHEPAEDVLARFRASEKQSSVRKGSARDATPSP